MGAARAEPDGVSGEPGHREEAARLGIPRRLEHARSELERVRSPEYVRSLVGTIGADPLHRPLRFARGDELRWFGSCGCVTLSRRPRPTARFLLPASSGLLQVLGVSFGVAVLIGNTILVGILRTPGDVAARLPNPGLFLGVWILGGLFALLATLSNAEPGAMLAQSGGSTSSSAAGSASTPASW